MSATLGRRPRASQRVYRCDAWYILDASERVLDLWPGEPSMMDDWIPVATISATEEKPAGEERP
jgi:hypothetical protein